MWASPVSAVWISRDGDFPLDDRGQDFVSSIQCEGYNFDKLKLLIDNGILVLITAINGILLASVHKIALQKIKLGDEAHFWLNGYVNKQNCSIWSEANPQVYVETPLHPEKLTVWCALWASGILLQKR
ncbi:hypothetical protein TNCV_3799231 [Trichonephila clavipes]|nr:hypothetical protein TNCV_3799231 [Trichonephila clavipes]